MVLIVAALACVESAPGWRNSVDAIEATLLTEGVCPRVPAAEVPVVNGTLYTPEWIVDDEETAFVYGLHHLYLSDDGELYTALRLTSSEEGTFSYASCTLGAPDTEPTSVPSGIVISVTEIDLVGSISAPLFLAAPPIEGWWQRFAEGVEQESTTYEGDSYGWLCLEHAEGIPGWYRDTTEGANWSGAMAMHVDDDGTGNPIDAFLSFESVDCASEEDACDYVNDGYGYSTSPECDGIDNDFDGVVDEGASDHDGDGVADCLPPEE